MVKCILAEQGRGGSSGGSASIFPTRLVIDTQPTKLAYQENDTFAIDGLSATVYYGDLGEAKIPRNIPYSNLTIYPDRPLIATDTEVIISYIEGEVTVSANIPITLGYSSLVDHAITDRSKTASAAPPPNSIGVGMIGSAIIQ